MIWRRLLVALCLALPLAAEPAQAAFDAGDLICETTTTTGTGTVSLAGAVTNYVTFVSQITSGDTVPYHIRASDGKLETGTGTFTDATPDTLTRTAFWSTDGSGAELTLPAGTHTVCVGPTTDRLVGADLSPQLGGDLDLLGQDIFDSTMTVEAFFNATENGFDVIGATDADGVGFNVYSSGDGAQGTFSVYTHDSASPADGDIPMALYVLAGADLEAVGSIKMELDDGTSTSEDTQWQFVRRVAGADVTALTLDTDVTIVGGDDLLYQSASPALELYDTTDGETGPFDMLRADFDNATPAKYTGAVIEADPDDATAGSEDVNIIIKAIVAGALDDRMSIGNGVIVGPGSTFPGAGGLAVGANDSLVQACSGCVTMFQADDGTTGPVLRARHSSASPADGDTPFALEVLAGTDQEEVGTVLLELDDGGTGSEDTNWRFFNDVAGTSAQQMAIGNGVIIGSGTTFPVGASGSVRLYSAADLTTGPRLEFHHDDPTADTNDYPMLIKVYGADDDENIGEINMRLDDDATGTEDSHYEFWAELAGTLTQAMLVGTQGVVIGTGSTFPGAGDLRVGEIELGADTDTTLARSGAGTVTIEGVEIARNTTSQTHTASTIELGNASDTTLSRSGAGELQVEGVDVVEANDSPTLGTVTTTGNIELGNASDTTLARAAAAEPTVEGKRIFWECGSSTATTSGDDIQLSASISASAKQIIVSLDAVSISGTDDILVVLGDSGGYETTGYLSGSSLSGTITQSTAGLHLNGNSGTSVWRGNFILQSINTTTWVENHTLYTDDGTDGTAYGGGTKATSAVTDRVRLSTSGANSFDAGAAYVCWSN